MRLEDIRPGMVIRWKSSPERSDMFVSYVLHDHEYYALPRAGRGRDFENELTCVVVGWVDGLIHFADRDVTEPFVCVLVDGRMGYLHAMDIQYMHPINGFGRAR